MNVCVRCVCVYGETVCELSSLSGETSQGASVPKLRPRVAARMRVGIIGMEEGTATTHFT